MKLRINKYKLAIRLMIVAGPILDLLTGYYQLVIGSTSELTPGVLYRGGVLIPVFFVLILKLKTNCFRIVAGYFTLVFLIGMGVHVLSGYDVEIVNHAQRFLKMLFPVLGFGSIMYLDQPFARSRSKRFLWKAVGQYGLITTISVSLFFLMGKGLAAYRRGFSSAAFFVSQNSIGFIFVASLSSLLYYIYVYRRRSLLLILTVEALFLLGAFLVGTRAVIVGVPATIVLFHGFTLFKELSEGKASLVICGIILLLVIALVGFGVYRFWSQQDVSYVRYKFRLLAEGEFRRQVPDGIERISEFNALEHLFGIGDAEFMLTENDLVDVYGKFGLLTLVPLLLFLARYYIGILFAVIKRRSLSAFVLLLPFTFYLAHASLAGHMFATVQSNNLFMLVHYLGYRELKAYRQKRQAVGVKRKRTKGSRILGGAELAT